MKLFHSTACFTNFINLIIVLESIYTFSINNFLKKMNFKFRKNSLSSDNSDSEKNINNFYFDDVPMSNKQEEIHHLSNYNNYYK